MAQSKVLTSLNYSMLAVFVLSILVQHNDPDALHWSLIYGAAALNCLFAARCQLHWSMPALVIVVALVAAGTLAPNVIGKASFSDIFSSMEMKSIEVEQARELGGLFIIVIWMTMLLFMARDWTTGRNHIAK